MNSLTDVEKHWLESPAELDGQPFVPAHIALKLAGEVEGLRNNIDQLREDMRAVLWEFPGDYAPGDWRNDLDEETAKMVRFAENYQRVYQDLPIPGSRLLKLIAVLARHADHLERDLKDTLVRLKASQEPENIVRRAADLLFRAYHAQSVQGVLKNPFKQMF